jgi:myosin heavy subunit
MLWHERNPTSVARGCAPHTWYSNLLSLCDALRSPLCRALTERIAALEQQSAEHGSVTTGLKDKLATEQANQEEIFEYLRAEIHKKNGEVNELKEQKAKLIEESEGMAAGYERRIREANDRAIEEKAELQRELASMKAEHDAIEHFIKKRDDLEEELADKTRLLEDNAKAAAESISNLERKHVQEKDRLKKEMLLKLRETKANLLKMTDNQLDTTTKRTIAENEQMSSELAWQSKETEKLIRKNDKLVGENQMLKRDLSLHKQTQEEFARKVNVYQKTIKSLLAKLNSLDASQQAELARLHLDDDEKERERAEAMRLREDLQEELTEAHNRLEHAQVQVTRLQTSLQEAESKHVGVLSLQDEAVKFTLQCLRDMQVQPPPPDVPTRAADSSADGESSGPSLSTLDPSQREAVLQYLFDQLRAYQHQLKELELQHAWKQHASAAGGETALSLPPIAGSRGAAQWNAPMPPAPFGDVKPGVAEVSVFSTGKQLKPYGVRQVTGKVGMRR